MKILKKFDSEQGKVAIVRVDTSKEYESKEKPFGAMWKNIDGWWEFGGSVGFKVARFETYGEAEAFIQKGLDEEVVNAEIWLDMVSVYRDKK